jgi:hypothetical protein
MQYIRATGMIQQSGRGVKLITHLYLVPKSRMRGAIPPLPWRGALLETAQGQLYLYLRGQSNNCTHLNLKRYENLLIDQLQFYNIVSHKKCDQYSHNITKKSNFYRTNIIFGKSLKTERTTAHLCRNVTSESDCKSHI